VTASARPIANAAKPATCAPGTGTVPTAEASAAVSARVSRLGRVPLAGLELGTDDGLMVGKSPAALPPLLR
jgi:hypothetical protein